MLASVAALPDLPHMAQKRFWHHTIDLLFTSKGRPVILPDGFTAASWLATVPGGHFEKIVDDAAE